MNNGNDVDAVVSLLAADASRRRDVSMYVGARRTATLRNVPNTRYIVHFMLGEGWDGKIFLADPSASEFDDVFASEKRTSATDDGVVIRTTAWSVSLHRVPLGNAKTRPVPVKPLEGETERH